MSERLVGSAATKELSLQWSLQWGLREGVRFEFTCTSEVPGDVYLFDRLWRLDGDNQPVIDPHPVYCFARAGSLRLLLGDAPLPRLRSVFYRNVPHASRLTKLQPHARTIVLLEPIVEYNLYFPELDPGQREDHHVDRIDFLLRYLVGTPDLRFKGPAPEDPAAFDIANPVLALSQAKEIHIGIPGLSMDVWRRTDVFERVTLPGELPEPL